MTSSDTLLVLWIVHMQCSTTREYHCILNSWSKIISTVIQSFTSPQSGCWYDIKLLSLDINKVRSNGSDLQINSCKTHFYKQLKSCWWNGYINMSFLCHHIHRDSPQLRHKHINAPLYCICVIRDMVVFYIFICFSYW